MADGGARPLVVLAERDAASEALARALRQAGRDTALIEPHSILGCAAPSFEARDVVAVATRAGNLADITRAVETLRRQPAAPEVVLAVLPANHRLCALHLIADDFAQAPADAGEIVLRIEVARARFGQRHAPLPGERPALRLDRESFTATLDDRVIALTFTEFELLRVLDDRRGVVVLRDTLARQVWGYEQLGSSRVVDVHMWRLRSKLEAGGTRLIETVRNRGYRLL